MYEIMIAASFEMVQIALDYKERDIKEANLDSQQEIFQRPSSGVLQRCTAQRKELRRLGRLKNGKRRYCNYDDVSVGGKYYFYMTIAAAITLKRLLI